MNASGDGSCPAGSDGYTGEPRLNKYTGNIEGKILNVCAYARVSTDDEDQLNSLKRRKSIIQRRFKAIPNGGSQGFFLTRALQAPAWTSVMNSIR